MLRSGMPSSACVVRRAVLVRLFLQHCRTQPVQVKRTTKFEKIFGVYCEKKGYDINTVRCVCVMQHLPVCLQATFRCR